MPPSRGDERPSSAGADRTKLAEWEARTFGALRRHRDLVTIVDDELPDDPLADLDETRSALGRIPPA
jgi:hypothetical protein